MGLRKLIAAAAALLAMSTALAQQKFITVASTTSTEQSGLFKHLLPVFEKKAGFQVRVVHASSGRRVPGHDLLLKYRVEGNAGS